MNKHLFKLEGFSEALADTHEVLQKNVDKSVDRADSMYISHGEEANEAAERQADLDAARAAAKLSIENQKSE